VDNNVTRHIPEELLNTDWNAMVLHYLGLDHIGHKAGPKRSGIGTRIDRRKADSQLALI
jgi:hypothetical protein